MSNETRPSLALEDFEPRSMLHTRESRIQSPAHKVIDFHSHLTWSAPLDAGDDERVTFTASPADLLPVMDRRNVSVLVNLTGGYGHGLKDAVTALNGAHPGRFAVFTEPWWSRVQSPGYPQFQADQIIAAKACGAQGLKILKTLG